LIRPRKIEAVAQTGPQQREVYYSGRVQGVGFRYTVRSLAVGFDVVGMVRNLPDGRVQLIVEGETAEVGDFLHAVLTEMEYYIRDVQELTRPPTGQFKSFEIRH
jgi:acylphosphatase